MIAWRRGLLASAAVVCIPMLARAGGDTPAGALSVALEYTAGPECPDARDFKAIVVDRLGYDPFRESAPDHVLVDVVSRGPGSQARLEWRNAAGRWTGDQVFPSRNNDCRQLVRAVGFALAVQIQLLAAATAPPESGADTPEQISPSATTSLPPPPAPAVANPPPNKQIDRPEVTKAAGLSARGPSPVFTVGAGASVRSGLASSPVPLGRVFGGVAWRRLSLELGGEVSLPAVTRREDGAGFSQQVLLVSAAGCGVTERWSGCLLVKAGEIRVVGQGVDVPASPWSPVLEAGLRLGVTQRLGRAYIALRAEGLAILTRWTVTLDRLPVWSAPPFAISAGLDFGIHLQ